VHRADELIELMSSVVPSVPMMQTSRRSMAPLGTALCMQCHLCGRLPRHRRNAGIPVAGTSGRHLLNSRTSIKRNELSGSCKRSLKQDVSLLRAQADAEVGLEAEKGGSLPVGEDAAAFDLATQSTLSWAMFTALLTGVLALLYAVEPLLHCLKSSAVLREAHWGVSKAAWLSVCLRTCKMGLAGVDCSWARPG
jgi:hypothetical protein